MKKKINFMMIDLSIFLYALIIIQKLRQEFPMVFRSRSPGVRQNKRSGLFKNIYKYKHFSQK
jgi:hypothetical protein